MEYFSEMDPAHLPLSGFAGREILKAADEFKKYLDSGPYQYDYLSILQLAVGKVLIETIDRVCPNDYSYELSEIETAIRDHD